MESARFRVFKATAIAALLVDRPVDDSHATTAQLAFDAIATEPLRAAGTAPAGSAASVQQSDARPTGWSSRGLGRLAELKVQEHVADPLGVLRASGRVLGGGGLLAQAAANVEFRGQEVAEQSRAVRPRRSGRGPPRSAAGSPASQAASNRSQIRSIWSSTARRQARCDRVSSERS